MITDILSLSEDDYALARRAGFGASDSSILLGVNPYKDVHDLIIEKRSTKITEEERKIRIKENVRKGRDLEPLILSKYAALMECDEPIKPTAMYQIVDTPCLTINFDGVSLCDGIVIPVECKYVSTYGDKYYDRSKAFRRELGTCSLDRSICRPYSDMVDRIKAKAEMIGIPPYYYTQCQQQMYGLGSPYARLCVLHDKGWETVVYHVPRDDECINALIISGTKNWIKVNK